MDPDIILAMIRLQAARLYKAIDDQPDTGLTRMTEDLLNTIEDLDAWLTGGGFPPEAWRPLPRLSVVPRTHTDTTASFDQHADEAIALVS
jgi:hypothetical protein